MEKIIKITLTEKINLMGKKDKRKKKPKQKKET